MDKHHWKILCPTETKDPGYKSELTLFHSSIHLTESHTFLFVSFHVSPHILTAWLSNGIASRAGWGAFCIIPSLCQRS